MACTANKTPLLRSVATRGYAAQASHKASTSKNLDIQTTTLPNKLVVASKDSSSAISRISIQFRAGSRNENYDTLGASHILRISGGLSTKGATQFGITRNVQEVGGNLSVTGDREIVAYTIEVTRNNLETGLKFLEATATGQLFKPWELADSVPRLRNELAAVSPQIRAVELLHKAAFRDGLGNSVLCPDHKVGKLSSETMQHFFAQNCTTNRAAVSAVGVDHNMILGFAQSLNIESGAGQDQKSSFHCGEVRCDAGGHNTTVAIGAQGAGWKTDLKEALAFFVLQHAAGLGPVTKYGGYNGALTKAVSGAAGTVGVTALNSCYSDTGLFGFVVSGDSKNIGKAVDAGVKALKSGSIGDDDVARGKAMCAAAILEMLETEASLVHDMGEQAALNGSVHNTAAIMAALDSVTASDVKSAARKVASGKLSIGAIGNLAHVPYVDQIN